VVGWLDRYPVAPPAVATIPVEARAHAVKKVTADVSTREVDVHGPRYQGVHRRPAVGEKTCPRCVDRTHRARRLFDNIGQLFGLWIVENTPSRRVAFPVAIANIAFHGDEPAPGTRVRLGENPGASITDRGYEFDAQLTRDGVVFRGDQWLAGTPLRQHSETDPAYRMPQRNLPFRAQQGGWHLTPERWPGLASRDLYLRKYLNARTAEYSDCRPDPAALAARRIAVKDAVRDWLWGMAGMPCSRPRSWSATTRPAVRM